MRKRVIHRASRRRPRAATADVLGAGIKKEKIPARWRAHYKHLIELQNHMAARQADLTRDASEQQPAFSTHMADAGTDTYDRDFALGMLSSEQDAAYEIEDALNRIRNGSYGVCELTGKPITAGRLEAIPWTRFSAEAEKQLERDRMVKRTGVGARGTIGEGDLEAEDEDEEEDGKAKAKEVAE